jgi:hypothetical protein
VQQLVEALSLNKFRCSASGFAAPTTENSNRNCAISSRRPRLEQTGGPATPSPDSPPVSEWLPAQPLLPELDKRCQAAIAVDGLKPRHHDVVVRAENGATLFRIRHQRESLALLLPLENVAERTLRDISDAVAGILQAASVQAPDSMANTRSKPKEDHVSRRPRKRENAEGVVHPTPP